MPKRSFQKQYWKKLEQVCILMPPTPLQSIHALLGLPNPRRKSLKRTKVLLSPLYSVQKEPEDRADSRSDYDGLIKKDEQKATVCR